MRTSLKQAPEPAPAPKGGSARDDDDKDAALPRSALMMAAVLAASALSAVIIAHPQPFAWEVACTRWIQRQDWLYLPLAAISRPGDSVLAQGGLLLLICGLLARRGWQREARTLAWVGVGGFLLNVALKALVGRARPTGEVVQLYVAARGWSFPSGHVMFYTAFYGGLAGFARRRLAPGIERAAITALCATLIGLVGLSRVFLGAHWPTDVAAGYGYGLAWLLATGAALWQPPPQSPAGHPAESALRA